MHGHALMTPESVLTAFDSEHRPAETGRRMRLKSVGKAGKFLSTRNRLDKSSVAQSLDGKTVCRGACVSPSHWRLHPPVDRPQEGAGAEIKEM
jgi:hypothetical protein